ncbi:uncharacterized protein LOC134196497 [Corticium candelabrum]|uniref:uncharacterized protein LOC134196497 n=1 Tax=Corticium candelabrum TaxID=121492 RepID=UPI002E25448B|nr:uncharacterized protein LOC134196497 [Corticium candelabrum]
MMNAIMGGATQIVRVVWLLHVLYSCRMKKQKVAVFGSSRPLVAFSLIEAVVFQRMYLRSLDHRMNRLILSDKHNEANLNKLKLIHGELLKFRSKFSSTPLSTTTAGKQQFQLWGTVVGLHEMAANLLETTKDLHDYYNDIAQRASQRKLDMLAVVLGFLGVAQLLSDIFWAWNQPDEKDDKNLLVPFTVSGGLLVVAIIFLLLTRQR